MMRFILGIVPYYQDQMMIWLWISLSFWNNRIPCTFLLCWCLQDEGYEDKGKVFPLEHISSPKLLYPECIILLWKVLSSVTQCWIQLKKLWQEELFSCANICAFQWNNQPLWYHFHWIIQCSCCETHMILILI